jgi:DNA-binding NarL/FixJ family response regulator
MTVAAKTRVLIADDHAVVRHGARGILAAEPDFEVVGEATDGTEALTAALALRPHMVVMDVAMPRMTGLQAARELSRRAPDLRVLMLSMHENEQYFFEALAAGASGYVLKSAVDRELVDACRATMRGQPFIHPSAAAALIRDYLARDSRDGEPPTRLLTDREEQLLKLIAEAHTKPRRNQDRTGQHRGPRERHARRHAAHGSLAGYGLKSKQHRPSTSSGTLSASACGLVVSPCSCELANAYVPTSSRRLRALPGLPTSAALTVIASVQGELAEGVAGQEMFPVS